MDIGEMRHSFVEAKEVPQRIDEFRRHRTMQILAGETPIELLGACPVFVVHAIPLSSFADDAAVPVTGIIRRQPLHMVGGYAGAGRLNADGFLFHSGVQSDDTRGYAQVYRSGVIEVASTRGDILRDQEQHGVRVLPSQWQEEKFIDSVADVLGLLAGLNVSPPVYIGLSLLRVKGVGMARPQRYTYAPDPIDKDTLIVPTVTSDTLEEPVDRLLRPAFDAIWQASGLDGSPYYDDEGNWTKR
jgi:hypothetical protein